MTDRQAKAATLALFKQWSDTHYERLRRMVKTINEATAVIFERTAAPTNGDLAIPMDFLVDSQHDRRRS